MSGKSGDNLGLVLNAHCVSQALLHLCHQKSCCLRESEWLIKLGARKCIDNKTRLKTIAFARL